VKTKSKTSVNSSQEVEELKKKIEELQRKNEAAPIPSDERIPVMSLCFNKLNLSVEPNGKGRNYSFTEFGQVKRIPYPDVANIINSQEKFLSNGIFYIMDSRVLEKHSLQDLYERILSKDMLEKVFGLSKEAVTLYQKANNSQRELINRFFIDKMAKDELVDLNVVSEISKISGIDLLSQGRDAKERLRGKE
jgi:hypothetical protein